MSAAPAPRVTRAAIFRAVRAGLRPLQAVPPMSLSEWAEKHFFLSPEGSHTQGQWESWPFQRGWMDAFSNDDIEEVTVRKSKRVGYTKTLLAFIAYNAAHRRRKQAMWQPTDDDRDSFVKSEVEPMLRDVKAMRPVLRTAGSEDTMKLKTFLGSVLHLLGGKAARAYRRITVAVSILDELDGFDQVIEKSSDPVTLAGGRLEGAPFPKLVGGSTPRIKNLSHVEHRERQADAVLRYRISCPHCGLDHPLEFGGKKVAHGFKWLPDAPETVRHVCPHCRESINQAQYLEVYDRGAWVDNLGRYSYGQDRIWRDAEGQPCKAPRHVAFVIWAAYSPQRAWSDIVREFLEASAKAKTGDTGPLQGFTNETLGETWEIKTDGTDEHALQGRPHTYDIGVVPPGCLKLCAGVDTQDDRLEVCVWGFGRRERMWLIDYQVIYGDPALDETWARLDKVLQGSYVQEGRQTTLPISGAAIDSGGHFTHHVYAFCRTRAHRRIVATHGSRFDGRPIKGRSSPQDINWRGQVIKRGVHLWEVGTDTAKDLLHARLRVDQPGPGYIAFPRDLPDEFYKQLTAEGRMLQKTSTGEKYRWVKLRTRNEVLDCTVLAVFVSHMLDLHRLSDRRWDQLQQEIEPAADLFSQPEQPQPESDPFAPLINRARPLVPARRKGGFATHW